MLGVWHIGQRPHFLKKYEQMLLVNGSSWAPWTSLVTMALSAATVSQNPAFFVLCLSGWL